uniref:Myosin light chain 11 n=1 Tax=Gasterosteus aculeatus aculeatus TaxID=481459 RepID=A0AAQ4NPI6_GASAC
MAPKKAKRRQAAGESGSSNVFSMFEQSQIQEYKEAFTIIDQNRDGIISKDDLRDVLASMGQRPDQLHRLPHHVRRETEGCRPRGRYRHRLQGAGPRGYREHQEGIPRGAPDHPVRQVHCGGDQEHVGRLPPRCCRQRGLQEHLLRHHTRRGEGGGVKRTLEDKTKKMQQSLCFFCLPFPLLRSSSSSSSSLTTRVNQCAQTKDLSHWYTNPTACLCLLVWKRGDLQ